MWHFFCFLLLDFFLSSCWWRTLFIGHLGYLHVIRAFSRCFNYFFKQLRDGGHCFGCVCEHVDTLIVWMLGYDDCSTVGINQCEWVFYILLWWRFHLFEVLLWCLKGHWTIRSGLFYSELDGWIHWGDVLQDLFSMCLLLCCKSVLFITSLS